MTKKQETPEEREAQFHAFVEASRELGCDEDPEAFKGLVRRVTKSGTNVAQSEKDSRNEPD